MTLPPNGSGAGGGGRPPTLYPSVRDVESAKWGEVQAQWALVRPRVSQYWTRLPKDEVELLSGDRASLVRLVMRYYALEQRGAAAQVNAWVAGLLPGHQGHQAVPPPARTKEEQRAEGERMGAVQGAASRR